MHLLSSDDLSKEQVEKIFDTVNQLKRGKVEISLREHTVAVLLFEKPSTRTRISFEAAVAQLGGASIYVDSKTSQLSRGESWSDTAKVISSYSDFIIARLFNHADILELAKDSSVPVINALTDLEHPTQAISDIYTILQKKKRLKGLKLAYIGDVKSNTANSTMLLGAKMGLEVTLIGPKGITPNERYFLKAREYGFVDFTNDIQEGVAEADVIYTDTFVSMGEEEEREERMKRFMPYQLNQQVLDMAKKDAIVMHCLPAHRGEEITADVIDGPNSIVFEQAKNKLDVEKAIILYMLGIKG